MAALGGDWSVCRRIRAGGGDPGLSAGDRGVAEGDGCGRRTRWRSELGRTDSRAANVRRVVVECLSPDFGRWSCARPHLSCT